MSILGFIVENFINIILIIGLIIAIFLTSTYKDKKSIITFILLILSFILLIMKYFIIYLSELDTYSTLLLLLYVFFFILQSIQVMVFVMLLTPIKLKNHIVISIPFVINAIVYLLSFGFDFVIRVNQSNQLEYGFLGYLGEILCIILFIIVIAYSIKMIKNNNRSSGLIALFSSITSIVAIIIEIFGTKYNLTNTALTLGALLIFINVYVKEQNKASSDQQKMIQEQRTAITISQIQPHFLYNALATIGYLCKKDPAVASKAIDQFADYLRANLNSISQKNNVPFMEELRHVKTYLWLEQLRFEERLQVEYDIQCKDFLIPSLSIQPLVENAVKHGICEKLEGGKVTIRTIGYSEFIKIVIEDDGVGFDMNAFKNDGITHVGLENVKSRIKSMCDGKLEVFSAVGKGTQAVITIPRG